MSSSFPQYPSDGDRPERRRAAADPRLAILLAQTPEPKKWSPLRPVLTVIATLMAVGLVIQIGMSFFAVRHLGGQAGSAHPDAMAEKAYLQEVYQTYGIRAASREEADLLLADLKRKEAEERQDQGKERARQEQERKQAQFEEESRRIGAQVGENLRRTEQEAERARQMAQQQEEFKARQAKEAEEARIERERSRWRSQTGSSGYSNE